MAVVFSRKGRKVGFGVKFQGRFAEWERPENSSMKLRILTRG